MSKTVTVKVRSIGPLGFALAVSDEFPVLETGVAYVTGAGNVYKFDGASRLVRILGEGANPFKKPSVGVHLKFVDQPETHWVYKDGKAVKRQGWKDTSDERLYYKDGSYDQLVDLSLTKPNKDGTWVYFWYRGASPKMLVFIDQPVKDISERMETHEGSAFGFRFRSNVGVLFGEYTETEKDRRFKVTYSKDAKHMLIRSPEGTKLKHSEEMLYHRTSAYGRVLYDYAVVPVTFKGG